MSANSLTAWLERAADSAGATPAVIYQGREIGFGDLSARSRRVARGLADLGVAAGDRGRGMAAQHAGLARGVFCLRPARRDRRGRQHAVPGRRGRGHRRPVGIQGAGPVARVQGHRFPGHPRTGRPGGAERSRHRRRLRRGRRRCGRADDRRADRHQLRPSGPLGALSGRPWRRRYRRLDLHHLGHDEPAEIRAPHPCQPVAARRRGGAGARLRPTRCDFAAGAAVVRRLWHGASAGRSCRPPANGHDADLRRRRGRRSHSRAWHHPHERLGRDVPPAARRARRDEAVPEPAVVRLRVVQTAIRRR